MRHADFFSSNPTACINLASNVDTSLFVDLAAIIIIIKKLKRVEYIDKYRLYDNVLQRHDPEEEPGRVVWKKMIPRSYQWSTINTYHTALKHFGWEKALAKLRET